MEIPPLCAPGCTNTGSPYCHCVDCGETFLILNSSGSCKKCSCQHIYEAIGYDTLRCKDCGFVLVVDE